MLSKEQKTPINNPSSIKKRESNLLICKYFSVVIKMTIKNVVIVVNKMNNIEIPSTARK